jgi:2-haloacid dehalogenase
MRRLHASYCNGRGHASAAALSGFNNRHCKGGRMANSNEQETAPVVAVDIGKVCVHLEPQRCAERFGFSDMDTLMSTNGELFAISQLHETGAIDQQTFVRRIAEALPVTLSAEAVVAAFCDLIGDEIAGMAEVIDSIYARGLRPVFLSDISETHFAHVRAKLSFADRIPEWVVSYEVGTLKPDAAMFEAMEQQFCDGRAPALYLDDKPENIAGAAARGWHGYKVGTVAGIQAALAALD